MQNNEGENETNGGYCQENQVLVIYRIFGPFLMKKNQPFLRQFLPELNFYITIYIVGKLKSGESFVILGPKLRVLSLKHGICFEDSGTPPNKELDS